MEHSVTIVFGKEEVNNYLSKGKLPTLLEGINVKEFYFETESEKNAFCRGIDEAVGWLEYCIVEEEDLIQVP